jgi:hypothetical protein
MCDGHANIASVLNTDHNLINVEIDKSDHGHAPQVTAFNPHKTVTGIQLFTTVTTQDGWSWSHEPRGG